MAEVPVLVPIGSSNMAGFFAKICDVSQTDIQRWYGPAALFLTAWPQTLPMPGVRVWQHRLPYATVEARNITGTGASTVTIDGAPLVSPTDVGTWIYIATNSTGRGQLARITVIGGGGLTLTVSSPFAPPLAVNGTIKIIRDSHRVAAGTTAQVIVKHADTPAFTSAVVGQFAVFPNAFDIDSGALTRKIIAQTATTITLDSPLSSTGTVIPVDACFYILTGAGAAQGIDDVTSGAALRPLAIGMDEAPFYSTGYDRNSWDMGTPFSTPLGELGVKPIVASSGANTVTVTTTTFIPVHDVGALIRFQGQTRTITVVNSGTQVTVDSNWSVAPVSGDRLILVRASVNCVAQLAWRMRAEFSKPMVILELGVSLSKVSPFVFAPGPITVSWAHDVQSLDFHPSSGNGLYQILAAAMTSCTTLLADEGHTPKFYVCINLADNDAVPDRYLYIGDNMTTLRDSLREHVSDPQMPFVMAGPSAYGATPFDMRPAIYEQMALMKSKDVWTDFFDTRGAAFTKSFDGAHYAAGGQIALAEGFADTLIAMLDRNAAAAAATTLDTSPAGQLAALDAAIAAALADGLPLVSFPGNGGQIEMMTLKEAAEFRKELVVLVNRQSGVRKTLARFG